MPVQLLPFQKLVDMPNMAQRHRRTICGLAIASIVLIFITLNLLVWAFIGSWTMRSFWSQVLFVFAGIPLMVIVLILVCTSSYISLRNTDKWVSTDTCCNLTRSHPACCTKQCAGNKHCCARMSCLHIAASVWTSLFCVLLVVLLFAGCNELDRYESQYQSGYDRRALRSSGCLDSSEENVKVGTHVTLIASREAFQKAFDAVPYMWDDTMVSLLGQKVTVVSRIAPGIFGLTKSDARSSQSVWYYPFSVIACVEDKRTTATTTPETDIDYSYYHVSAEHQNSVYNSYTTKYRYPQQYTTTPRHLGPYDYSKMYKSSVYNSYTTKYRYPQQYTPTPRYPGPYGHNKLYASRYNDYPQYDYYYGDIYYGYEGACKVLAGFEVPALVLMFCLAIITARSACLLRAIEQEMPQIEPLPAGKMVVLAFPDTAEVPPAPVETVCVAMGEENSTADVKTEQDV